MTDPWPLRGLVLRTPRLELRPATDPDLYALVGVAERGIHPPEEMPFGEEWTDADPRYLGRGILQYHWRLRAELSPQRWTLPFAVRTGGRVIGLQYLSAREFPVLREVCTGSWLGMADQGKGYGAEMRAAVLTFAFDHLGARTARSSARAENTASLAISRKLGYRPDGTEAVVRRGEPTTDVRMLLDRASFVRPAWATAVEGAEPCFPLLGAW
ncbi:Protein N-acetyltransferase, RimJ/RimL family [Pseudonocardia thermophila]|jgi:Acetyltransferases, including N-acetylases of ribosomal proteins|uniref:Protein N-acetyltransferase, RimJ/RimL family n=1 Tax=Pseudonocardia thermophila TaxID=1848 RepID=A0A1M6SNS6_PSETH|nr:GNAT family protein [Pseudonocardia thermophila]SHK46290.1 Protein N-acetyltransferase, RimJ/RimL family [Pseudonocardia thermophila]